MAANSSDVYSPLRRSLIIAGQGTIALEMLAAAPDLDVLIVPIGGGGLISGIAVAAKTLNPNIEIIGVQAALYPSMYNLIKGERLPKKLAMSGDTLAEGIAVKAPGKITSQIVRALVDDIVLVSEQTDRAGGELSHHHREDRHRRRGRRRPCGRPCQ